MQRIVFLLLIFFLNFTLFAKLNWKNGVQVDVPPDVVGTNHDVFVIGSIKSNVTYLTDDALSIIISSTLKFGSFQIRPRKSNEGRLLQAGSTVCQYDVSNNKYLMIYISLVFLLVIVVSLITRNHLKRKHLKRNNI